MRISGPPTGSRNSAAGPCCSTAIRSAGGCRALTLELDAADTRREGFTLADQGDVFQARAAWVGLEELPVLVTNQFIGQANIGEIVLTFGHVTVPVLLGSEEERREMA